MEISPKMQHNLNKPLNKMYLQILLYYLLLIMNLLHQHLNKIQVKQLQLRINPNQIKQSLLITLHSLLIFKNQVRILVRYMHYTQ